MLDVKENVYGKNHLKVGDSYANIGLVYGLKEEYGKTLEYY